MRKGGKIAIHMSEMHGVKGNICLDLFSDFVLFYFSQLKYIVFSDVIKNMYSFNKFKTIKAIFRNKAETLFYALQ